MPPALKRQSALKAMLQLRYFRIVMVLSLLMWLALVVLPTVRVVPIIYGKTAVPLHYNIHVGVDKVGPWWQIYVLPAIGLALMIVNGFLSRFMWSRDPVLSYMLSAATLVLEILLFVAMIFIVFLSLSYA